MKRIVGTTLVVLGLLALATAQSGTAPGSGFQLSGPAQRKAPPSAKTPEEGTAYQAIVANTDLAGAETAAKDFETKYGRSELRGPIYQSLMYRYRQANNADKTVEMGRKVLQFDPDNPMALVTVAGVISERTRETDLDRDQRLGEATQDAKHALDSMDNWLATAPGISDAQAQGARPMLVSVAHAVMGTLEMERKNLTEAEKHYRTSLEANPARPDPVTLLRLALTLDQQKRYAEALPFAKQAVELSASTGGVANELAKQEQERLAKLTGQTPPAPAPQQPAAPPKAAAPAQTTAPPHQP